MLPLSHRRATGLLLASLALVATLAVTCCHAREKKTQEELEFDAARAAYKDLFVHSSSQSPKKALAKLDALTKVYGRLDLDMPFDYYLLLSFNQTEEVKCNSYEYVSKLKNVYDQVEANYRALRKYMHDCLERQLDLCDFERRYREQFEQFKAESPGQWNLIQEFNKQAEESGKRSSDWQSGALDNEIQMNQALERIARKTAKRGEDPYKNAYQMAVDIRYACSRFDDRLAAGLLMTTIGGKNRKNKEIKEWYRLMSVCRQVNRVSFERSLGDIIGYTYMPAAQKSWESYRDFSELYLQ